MHHPFLMLNELQFFSLFARVGQKFIDKCLINNKGWKEKFFHASIDGLYDLDLVDDFYIPTIWSPELRGKVFISSLILIKSLRSCYQLCFSLLYIARS